ncbi:tRNA synthetases class I-domain-containing protein, partial [Protomyces lactucae-debilis]
MAWVVPASSTVISRELDATDYGNDVSGAIKDAKGKVYICGSLYLIGQVHRLLQVAQLEDTARKNVPRGPYNPALIEAWANKYLSKENTRRLTDSSIAKRFILPPPNVTGTLHIGHALTVAIQDAYVRFFKFQGEQVTWAPGMDHAGIATQTVVAKMLAKQGVDIRRLGADLDWDLEYFTLDEERSEAVIEAFGKLWQDGLVRRDVRMVNWSDRLQSVISDIEVDSLVVDTPKIIQGAEFGKIWTIAYQMVDRSGKICVQTTRPETVPGDRAIAVHPDDERYKDLIGKCVQHPLLSSVSLPIVADAMVDPLFGTGAVKLTPAHDANDYAASRRHAIELVTIFDKHGKFLPSCGLPDLVGHDRLESRSKVVEKLAAAGALITVQQHSLRLGVCSRTGAVIEPCLMPQWFIHMQPLADKVLQQDTIQMSIQTKREWLRWLENVQDWCVSRQLVWGHRVPLYRIVNTDGWFFARSFADAQKAANGKPIVQESDVLDTWFSSGILPLSAYGWPRDDTSPWRPLSFIESGPDILFFWLARMAMLCTHFTGFAPFKEILLHPLVRDSQGRKMSKSLGNVLDPLHIIDGCSLEELQAALAVGNLSAGEVSRASQDLARSYPQGIQADGADALRFALVDSTVQDSTLNLDIRSVKAARYVGGKLWNVLNFIEFHQQTQASSCVEPQNRSQIMDHWILQRLLNLQEDVHESFAKRTLHRATSSLRFFIVNDLCDTYLEFLKYDLKGLTSHEERCKVLATLRQIMVELSLLIKPFMPFLADSVTYRL